MLDGKLFYLTTEGGNVLIRYQDENGARRILCDMLGDLAAARWTVDRLNGLNQGVEPAAAGRTDFQIEPLSRPAPHDSSTCYICSDAQQR